MCQAVAGKYSGWGIGCNGTEQNRGRGLYLFILWGPGWDPFIRPSITPFPPHPPLHKYLLSTAMCQTVF